MLPIFARALAQYRWQVLGWGGILLLLGLITIPTYDVVLEKSRVRPARWWRSSSELLGHAVSRMDQLRRDLGKSAPEPGGPRRFPGHELLCLPAATILGFFAGARRQQSAGERRGERHPGPGAGSTPASAVLPCLSGAVGRISASLSPRWLCWPLPGWALSCR